MYTGRTVFSQIMDALPMDEFRCCVDRYSGDYKVQSFSCLDQFLTLAFAQLSYRESLRDIETCLRAMQPRLYHMGFRGKVSRNNLAHANENRDWRIYADLAQILIRQARLLYSTPKMSSVWSWNRLSTLWIRPPSTSVCPCSRGLPGRTARPL